MNRETLVESLLATTEAQQQHAELVNRWNAFLPKFYELYALAGVKPRRFLPPTFMWPKVLDINISPYETPELGTGVLCAGLSHHRTSGGQWEPGGYPIFTVNTFFQPSADGSAKVPISEEQYNFGLFNSGLEPYRSRRENARYIDSLPEQMTALDETISLLKKAIQDPELNPQFAGHLQPQEA